MSNKDCRQAIFFRTSQDQRGDPVSAIREAATPRLTAQMIDNGFVMGVIEWEFESSPVQGLCLRRCVYQSVQGIHDFEPWLERIKHVPEELLAFAAAQVPCEWIQRDEHALQRMLDRLVRRQEDVPDLIYDCLRAKQTPFPNWRST